MKKSEAHDGSMRYQLSSENMREHYEVANQSLKEKNRLLEAENAELSKAMAAAIDKITQMERAILGGEMLNEVPRLDQAAAVRADEDSNPRLNTLKCLARATGTTVGFWVDRVQIKHTRFKEK